MIVLGITVALNVYLYAKIPKGFFPQQDTGTLTGNLRADQSISFQAMAQKLRSVMAIVQADPAVQGRGRLHRRRWRPGAAPPTPPISSSD